MPSSFISPDRGQSELCDSITGGGVGLPCPLGTAVLCSRQ
jgi:hypothetical protein